MSKITLSKPTSGYNLAAINANFTKIEAEFQSKVLYRDNPVGEPNASETDIDLNGNSLLNVQDLNVLGTFTANGVNFDSINSAFMWKGVWNIATNYAVSDAVSYNGSSFICITAHINSAPPSANWNVLASAGASGSGTGDVSGPASSVAGNVPTFSNTSGKLIGDSGINISTVGGAKGGGTDKIFYENGQTVTTDYTLTASTNALTAGPVTINTGITVTIPTGANWSIV